MADYLEPVGRAWRLISIVGCTLAAVGGVMVAISLDELIPAAKALVSGNLPILGVALGILVMALSLWMLH